MQADLAWELMNNLNVDDDSALVEVFALLEIYTVKHNGVGFAYSRKCDKVGERPLAELLQTSTKHVTLQLHFLSSANYSAAAVKVQERLKPLTFPSYIRLPTICTAFFNCPKIS